MMDNFPTPYYEVNSTLRLLLKRVRRTLGSQFAGLYLYGSLAGSDFIEATSDIDFLVVTSNYLTGNEIHSLESMHSVLLVDGLKWAKKLEGTYLPLSALPRYDPAGPAYPTLNESRFYLAPHGFDWIIQRHVLREHGVVVAGPPIKPWIDPVEPEDLRQAVIALLESWWTPMIVDPTRLQSDAYQAYAILSMCRARYTLQNCEVVSKPEAARWAQSIFGEHTARLVKRALDWRPGKTMNALQETLDLIRTTQSIGQQSRS